jgi:hypothetical protein
MIYPNMDVHYISNIFLLLLANPHKQQINGGKKKRARPNEWAEEGRGFRTGRRKWGGILFGNHHHISKQINENDWTDGMNGMNVICCPPLSC